MPTRIMTGDRIGKQGRLRLGCSATIFDAQRQKILLTRRSDNGLWCLPGGGMDSGESLEETCIREVYEETGLQVRVIHLVGIYSSPHWLVEYPDGNRVQIVAMNFEVEVIGGTLNANHEVKQMQYFAMEEIEALELMINHRQRILDAFSPRQAAYIR